MIIIAGTFEVHPDDRERALTAFAAMTAASQDDRGCSAYGFWVDPSNPHRFRAYEEWEDARHIEAHMATPHAAAFIAALRALRISDSDVWRYDATRSSRVGS